MNKAIKKIELDLGGKTVTLTPEQAKNLKEALDDLFGKEIVRVIEYVRDSYPVPVPYPTPIQPYYPIWEYHPNYLTTGIYTDDKCYCINGDNDTLRLTG